MGIKKMFHGALPNPPNMTLWPIWAFLCLFRLDFAFCCDVLVETRFCLTVEAIHSGFILSENSPLPPFKPSIAPYPTFTKLISAQLY